MPVIVYFCCLIALRFQVLCWIVVAGVGILAWFLILGESFQFFTIEYVNLGLLIYLLLCWGNFIQFLVCWALFSWKSLEFFKMPFLPQLRWSFNFNVVHYIDWFSYVKPSLHSRYKSLHCKFNPWSWCIILSMCFWVWCAGILLRVFISVFSRHVGL